VSFHELFQFRKQIEVAWSQDTSVQALAAVQNVNASKTKMVYLVLLFEVFVLKFINIRYLCNIVYLKKNAANNKRLETQKNVTRI